MHILLSYFFYVFTAYNFLVHLSKKLAQLIFGPSKQNLSVRFLKFETIQLRRTNKVECNNGKQEVATFLLINTKFHMLPFGQVLRGLKKVQAYNM